MISRIGHWWPKSFRGGLEQFGPFFMSLLLTFTLWQRSVGTTKGYSVATELASPLVSVMAISAGFVAASLTILTSAVTKPIRRIREHKFAYGQLVNFHAWATYLGMIACAISLLVLAQKQLGENNNREQLAKVWFFINAWAGSAFVRVLYLLVKMLRPVDES